MSIQIAYTIAKPLSEETVKTIWRYVSGKLCDLYGAQTAIHLGGPTWGYVIERTNELPFLPRIDKILEITFPGNSTLINCYFARDRYVIKTKSKLEEITGEAVTVVKLVWKRIDIEAVLRKVNQ